MKFIISNTYLYTFRIAFYLGKRMTRTSTNIKYLVL